MINKMKFNFVKYFKQMFVISVSIFTISILSLLFIGIPSSIDFTGGTIINIKVDTDINLSNLRQALEENLNQSVSVVEVKSNNESYILLKMSYLSDEQVINDLLKKVYGNSFTINQIESIGPKIGDELRVNARNAIIASLLLIGLYISIRFDGYYAIGSLFALLHDVFITLGIFVFMNVEISISIIAALLTIVGYSLNDTIVIYDRIRENMSLNPYRDKKKIFNTSLNQTLNRTLVTSLTTLIVVLVLYFYGGDVLQPFSIALIIGIILGTYSSIFIASPVTLFLEEKYNIEEEED
ncbi:MAG: protein translocase subunit SecF [Candidatus Marinimicrobia bacterium]|nr:protein translocase subunit SecF [Candidatus Neomarinimicrobiota bacterium]|tara:strand:+ start:25485 stop:26372 length:888 start_codon:yes stop_codon:yes gene_type:complete